MKLKKLYNDDQTDRKKLIPNGDFKKLTDNDMKRKLLIENFLKKKTNISPEDAYYISFIFQHGRTVKDSLKAIKYARISMEGGFEKAKWLYAASVDRLQMKKKLPQKYGTQYFKKDSKSKFKLYKVDKAVKDSERIALGLPTIKEAKSKEKDFN